jgi:hypothetical protein
MCEPLPAREQNPSPLAGAGAGHQAPPAHTVGDPLADAGAAAMAEVMAHEARRLYVGAMEDAHSIDPAADGMTRVISPTEAVLVTILVVALLIVAAMLYPT